jgi:hypothetical protein
MKTPLFVFCCIALIVAHQNGAWSHKSKCAEALSNTPQSDTIYFKNASFEDRTGASVVPMDWLNIGRGSTPDILPGAWKLEAQAHLGNTCLGLVTRDDGSVEGVAQKLSEALVAEQCYEFSAWLCRLPKYVGHNQPCQLRIYAGDQGASGELLAQSPLVSSTNWTQHRFQFTAKSKIKSISLVVWYGPGILFKYKGNMLIDDLSPIVRCDRA